MTDTQHATHDTQGDGDCFVVAATLVVFENEYGDDAMVCHGTCTGQGKINGIAHDHAWIEVELGGTTFVIDRSNGKCVVMTRDRYYALGECRYVHRYTPAIAQRRMAKTGHFGPWHTNA